MSLSGYLPSFHPRSLRPARKEPLRTPPSSPEKSCVEGSPSWPVDELDTTTMFSAELNNKKKAAYSPSDKQEQTLGSQDEDSNSMNSLKVLEESAIDELLSLGSVGGGGGSASSQPLGPLSPSTIPSHTDSADYDPWRLTNPVHMELQENAKLPTFNWSVDRTGSSVDPWFQNPHFRSLVRNSKAVTSTTPTTRQEEKDRDDRMEAVANGEKVAEDVNLGELFLQNNSRAGYHASFQHVGVLQRELGSNSSSRRQSVSIDNEKLPPPSAGVEQDLAEALANVDPTPLSEIRQRAMKHHHQLSYRGPGHPARARPVPLPVPGENSQSMIERESLSDALATAAAIASHQGSATIPAIAPNASVTQTLDPSKKSVNSNRGRSASWSLLGSTGQSKYNTPLHTIKHISSQDASKRHEQYGFGAKHVVPSVPPPPAISPKQHQQFHAKAGQKSASKPPAIPTAVSLPSRKSPAGPLLAIRTQKTAPSTSAAAQAVSSAAANNNSSTEAYERKKQRAKDARVKLNESIDRLAIAINLAGAQSKQRVKQWENLAASNNQASGLKITKDCVRTATSAKKFDRPGFVGTAATLIEGLNAQCEALMRELVDVQERYAAAENDATNALETPLMLPRPLNAEKRAASPLRDTTESHKRPRVEEEGSSPSRVTEDPDDTLSTKLGPVFGNRKILEHVATFMDAQTLVRCHRTCKGWKDATMFTDESLWETFVLRRFGFYNVRQWRGRMDDDENDTATPSISLYKFMDNANVMPHFSTDGLLLLGEARLAGKVSAWTFMVERSNGETLRSVRRHTSMSGKGAFVSLPVVELRTVVQNTGVSGPPLILRRQTQTVDASTRRRSEEMKEIEWDERFHKRVLNLDGSHRPILTPTGLRVEEDLCHLGLYDVVVVVSYIYAKGCSTTSKFIQRSNFTKILVQISNCTTIPVVIPFPRDALSLHH